MVGPESFPEGYEHGPTVGLKYKYAWWHPHCDLGCNVCVHWTTTKAKAREQAWQHHETGKVKEETSNAD